MPTRFSDFATATTAAETDLVMVVQGDVTCYLPMSLLTTLARTLTSPDGTEFLLTVDDTGTLTAEEIV